MSGPAGYGIDNLPFGIVSDARDGEKRPAVAFEDKVIDLDCLVHRGVLDADSLLGATTLNAFLGEGLDTWRAVRARLQHLLDGGANADERAALAKAMRLQAVTAQSRRRMFMLVSCYRL